MTLSMIGNLDYTILPCKHLAETKLFYRDVMGFPVVMDSERWVSFRVGSVLLTLRPRGPWLETWDDGPLPEGSTPLQLAFRVPPSAIEACQAELLAKGVPLLRGITDIETIRHRTVFVRDPEGNVVEIYAEY
jgi:catechol 2,3-dioxygenase-like lactoylglutathione lyase family enzyme